MVSFGSLPRGPAADWYAAGAAAGAAATLAVCYARSAAPPPPPPPPQLRRHQQPLPAQRRRPPPHQQRRQQQDEQVVTTRQSVGPAWTRSRRRRREKPKLLATHPKPAADRARQHVAAARSISRSSAIVADDPPPARTPERAAPADHCHEPASAAGSGADTPRTERKKKMKAAFASLNSEMEAEAEVPAGSEDGGAMAMEDAGHALAPRASESDEDTDEEAEERAAENAVQRLLECRAKRNSRDGSPAQELRQLVARNRSTSRSPKEAAHEATAPTVKIGSLVQMPSAPEAVGRASGDEDCGDGAIMGGKLRATSGAKPLSLSRPAVGPTQNQQRRAGQIMAEILQAETLLGHFRPSAGSAGSVQLQDAQQLTERLRGLRSELQLGCNTTSSQRAKLLQEDVVKRLRQIFTEIRSLLLATAGAHKETSEAEDQEQPAEHSVEHQSPEDDDGATSPKPSPQLGAAFDFLGSTLKAELKNALKAPQGSPTDGEEGPDDIAMSETAGNLSPILTAARSPDGEEPSSPTRMVHEHATEQPLSPAMRTSPGVIRSIDLDPSSPEDDNHITIGTEEAVGKLSPPEGFAHGLAMPPVYDSPAQMHGAIRTDVSPPAITPPPAWKPAAVRSGIETEEADTQQGVSMLPGIQAQTEQQEQNGQAGKASTKPSLAERALRLAAARSPAAAASSDQVSTSTKPASRLDELLQARLRQKLSPESPSGERTSEDVDSENCNTTQPSSGSIASSSSKPLLQQTSSRGRVALGEISCNSASPDSQPRQPKVQSAPKPVPQSAELRQQLARGAEAEGVIEMSLAEVSVESLRQIFGSPNVSSRSTTEESTEGNSVDDEDAEEEGSEEERDLLLSPPSPRSNSSPGAQRPGAVAATPVGWSALLSAIENVDRSVLKARQRTPPERRLRPRHDANPLHDALTATLAKINRVNRSESESECSSRCSPSMGSSEKKGGHKRRSEWSSSECATPSPAVVVVSPGLTHLAV
jgi:hypothetical protein